MIIGIIERQIRSTIKLISEMTSEGMDEVLRQNLVELKDQKIEKQRRLCALQLEMQNSVSSTEDRKKIELNALEFKRAKSKATPATLKRLLHRLVSGIALRQGVAKVAYWTGELEQQTLPNPKTKMAADEKLGAINLLKFHQRKLVMGHTFGMVPAVQFGNSDQVVGSGYIVANGARKAISIEHFF